MSRNRFITEQMRITCYSREKDSFKNRVIFLPYRVRYKWLWRFWTKKKLQRILLAWASQNPINIPSSINRCEWCDYKTYILDHFSVILQKQVFCALTKLVFIIYPIIFGVTQLYIYIFGLSFLTCLPPQPSKSFVSLVSVSPQVITFYHLEKLQVDYYKMVDDLPVDLDNLLFHI